MSAKANNQVVLKSVPQGLLSAEHLEVRQAPYPADPAAGEVLVESHYVSLDAALRLITRDSKDFLFRVAPGDVIFNSVAGRVVASGDERWAPGDYVIAPIGVQNYGLCSGDMLERVDLKQAPLSAWLGGFGTSGLTAYFGIFHECKPQPGDTVVVNGAAGAVGTMAGQFAKLAGARVIGIAGSDEKCTWLVDALNLDAALNYKGDDLYAQLVDAAPDRINYVFDNVGGHVLDQSLRWIAMRGKVLLCGSTSQYVADEMLGPKEYIWLGTMRASLQGYVYNDYTPEFPLARKRMAAWLADGRISMPEHCYDGDVADFGDAFRQLYEGANKGKMLLKLPAAEA